MNLNPTLTRRSAGALAFAAIVGFATGCATRPEVRTDQDPRADLASYRTFGFGAAAESSPYGMLLAARLQAATRAQLERAHYVYSEDDPDLRVQLLLVVEDRQQIRSLPASRVGWRGWSSWSGGDIETVDYRQGTLAIDLVDAKRNTLVWHGVAEGRLDAKAVEQPGPAIEAAVGEIFMRFPGAAARP